MDKVRKRITSVCYTPSSETYIIYQYICSIHNWFILIYLLLLPPRKTIEMVGKVLRHGDGDGDGDGDGLTMSR
jgi:hypothetical protein